MSRAKGAYIGTPGGIVLCIDKCADGTFEGRMYHGYASEAIPIFGFEDVIRRAEQFFNDLGFPQAETSDRDFAGNSYSYRKKEGMVRQMSDEELLEEYGDLSTFLIRVQHRQHSSWQGSVVWTDKNETAYFRSALELIKLIDGALAKSSPAEEKNGDQ